MSRLVARAAVTVMPGSTATWMVPGPTVTATVLRSVGQAGLDSLAAGHDGSADADPPGDDEGGGQAGRLGGPGPGSRSRGRASGGTAGDRADQHPAGQDAGDRAAG